MPMTDELVGGGGPPGNDADAEMIRAVLGGDPEAYRVLVERYERRIYYVVYGMVRNSEDARDLAQECFVKAFQNLHRFRLDSKFYTWVCRIAMNLSIDHLRKMKHRGHSEFDEMRGRSEGAQVVRLHSKPVDPSEQAIQKQLMGQIEKPTLLKEQISDVTLQKIRIKKLMVKKIILAKDHNCP